MYIWFTYWEGAHHGLHGLGHLTLCVSQTSWNLIESAIEESPKLPVCRRFPRTVEEVGKGLCFRAAPSERLKDTFVCGETLLKSRKSWEVSLFRATSSMDDKSRN